MVRVGFLQNLTSFSDMLSQTELIVNKLKGLPCKSILYIQYKICLILCNMHNLRDERL